MSATWRDSALATRRWTTAETTKAGHGHTPPARVRDAGGGASADARRSPRSTQRYQDTGATQSVARWQLEIAEGSGESSSRSNLRRCGLIPPCMLAWTWLPVAVVTATRGGPDRVSVRDGLAM